MKFLTDFMGCIKIQILLQIVNKSYLIKLVIFLGDTLFYAIYLIYIKRLNQKMPWNF